MLRTVEAFSHISYASTAGFIDRVRGPPRGQPSGRAYRSIGGDYQARQRRREHFRFQLLACQQLKFPMSTDAMPKAPATHVSENGVDFFAAHPPFLGGSSFSCHSGFADVTVALLVNSNRVMHTVCD